MFANYLSYTGLLFWIKNSQNPIRKQQCNCFKGQPPPLKKWKPKTFVFEAHLASLSMGFPRQEYWSGLPSSSPGDHPDPGIQPFSPELQADSLLLSHQEAFKHSYWFANKAVLVRRRGTTSKSQEAGNFLVVQRLGLHTSMQGTRIWSLVGKLRYHLPRGLAKTKQNLRDKEMETSVLWLQRTKIPPTTGWVWKLNSSLEPPDESPAL